MGRGYFAVLHLGIVFLLPQQDKQINPASPTITHINLYQVFLYFFSRELCEESMTQSVSSASSLDSHAPSEHSGQSLGARWEEQQKVLALEQLCGVFRVDLGHMRSLRLFFRSAGGHAWLRCCCTVFNEHSNLLDFAQ